jgi:hypothetical protein
MVNTIQLVYLLRFYIFSLGNKEERGVFHMVLSVACSSSGRYLLHVDDFEA